MERVKSFPEERENGVSTALKWRFNSFKMVLKQQKTALKWH